MKVYLKVLATNSKDFKTAILVGCKNSHYFFNMPDGLQKVGQLEQPHMKSLKIFSAKTKKYIFVSSLHPDFFGGFPGYYLSFLGSQVSSMVRRAKGRPSLPPSEQELLSENFHVADAITLLGPAGLRRRLRAARAFLGPMNCLRVIELAHADADKLQGFGIEPGGEEGR